MATKFDIEKVRGAFLLEQLGITPEDYHDPNRGGVQESGADVVAVIDGHRIGIQVTDIDTGAARGKARAAEKHLARGDPEGWADREVIRVLTEPRQAQEKSR